MADVAAGVATPASLQEGPGGRVPLGGAHEFPGGYFSSEAVGYALGRRRFDWRGVRMERTSSGADDPGATMAAAFAPVQEPGGPYPTLGVFVHQGAHYTAMIARGGRVYHVDSLPGPSGEGRYVYEVSSALFAAYVRHFWIGRDAPGGRRVGGLFRVFYAGAEILTRP